MKTSCDFSGSLSNALGVCAVWFALFSFNFFKISCSLLISKTSSIYLILKMIKDLQDGKTLNIDF
nr:hypothetical protein [uncultured Campylobacter sp.]